MGKNRWRGEAEGRCDGWEWGVRGRAQHAEAVREGERTCSHESWKERADARKEHLPVACAPCRMEREVRGEAHHGER